MASSNHLNIFSSEAHDNPVYRLLHMLLDDRSRDLLLRHTAGSVVYTEFLKGYALAYAL